ncbi:hypothetical protein BGX31_005687, partial [Mortierella sp. GBA43]
MKSLLLPFVLAQLAVFSHAQPEVKLQNADTKLFLEPLTAPHPIALKVVAKPYEDSPNQLWEITRDPAGAFIIGNVGTHMNLAYQSTENGDPVYVAPEHFGDFEDAWRFVGVET